ncbi:MAG: acyl-ACP desaturase [Alphaproteobacteria bacterium]|nr:acyl-ACP desaturase [Alphaproteobacteria bacterium]
MDFFEKAERRRRWSVFDDIPWDKVEAVPHDETAALCAETFCGVEMYLPDYVAQGINCMRDTFGHGWFVANWGYEESKHALSLRMWLEKSGHRTWEQILEFERAVLSKRWEAPFTTPRQLSCYGAIQEQATFVIYRRQLECARERGDVVLAAVYEHISKDEAAHAGFYRDVLKLELEEDREGALADLAHTFANFQMPGVGLVPEYDARVGVMRSAGIDRNVFLTRVWLPTLKQLGVSRTDLLRARRPAVVPASSPSPEQPAA